MVPCSLFAPDVNDDLRAASRAELRNAGDVVVALLMVAAITRPAALTVMATITWPSLVGSLYSGCGRLIGDLPATLAVPMPPAPETAPLVLLPLGLPWLPFPVVLPLLP